MTNEYLKTLEEAFQDPNHFSKEKMEKVVAETVEYLKDLKERFESGDPHVQEKAMEMALVVQKGLEAQVESICKATGLDLDTLSKMASDMAPAEKAELTNADAKFDAALGNKPVEARGPRLKRSNKINLVG